MRALPIVERELRVWSRRSGTYWGRVGAAVLALGLACAVYFTNFRLAPSRLAAFLFFALAWLAFVYCLLAGVRLTADSISEERREGTLGLLFLTDLRGFDIVLGKLAATSLHSVYSLLAILPVLAMPLLMGGVGLDQLARVTVVLLQTLLLSLSVGIFVSCWCSNGRRASGMTFLVLLLITLGPWFLFLLEATETRRNPPDFRWAVPSPLFAQAMAATEPGRGKPDHLFWPSVACVLVFGLGFLTAACAALPRVWRELPRLVPGLAPRPDAARQDSTNAGEEESTRFRRRLLDANPFHWLTARDRRRSWYVLGFLGCMGLFWLYADDRWRVGRDPGWHVTVSAILHVVMKGWIALVVVQQLGEERRSGSIELLLSTPLTLGQVVGGQFQSLVRQFGWPLLIVLLADVALLQLAMEQASGDRLELGVAALCHMASLILDAAAIGMLGIWRSVVARHSSSAAGSAFTRVVVLPWLVAIAVTVLVEASEQTRRIQVHVSPLGIILGFYLMSAVNSVGWALYGWLRLKQDFRAVAARRFERGRSGWFRSWWESV